MAPEHLEFLAKRLKLTFYAEDEKITDPDGGPAGRFYIIKQGRVRCETPSEDEQISGNTWELVPGECFPVGALLSRRAVRTVHRAAEDTFCFELGRDDFNQLLKLSEEFSDFCTRRLASLLDQLHRQVQANAATGLGGDSSLNITLGERIRREPVTCLGTTPIRDALQAMTDENVGSIIVTDEDQRPIGVFTLRDLLTRVAMPGLGMDEPMERVMTPDPFTLPPSAFAFEAAMQMARYKFHHVCVAERGRLIGVISERDLFSLQRVGLVNLSKTISRSNDIESLAALEHDIHQLVSQMIAQGVQVDQMTQIITLLNDHITRRVIEICRKEFPKASVQWTWIAFGSEGRQEQTLKTDQDNGILFETSDEISPDAVREELLPLARRINEALDQCGYPLCKGNIMASNPECCLSANEWRQRFAQWIDHGTPENLLKATIFFDFRLIEGDAKAVDALREWLTERVPDNPRFLHQMAANALRNRPPLGLVRDFVVSDNGEHPNTIDLKLHGLTPFVDGARILALAHGIPETSTLERMNALIKGNHVSQSEAEAWINAYAYIQLLRMRQHREQAAHGEKTSNRINPDNLNDLDRRILRESFRQARKLQSRIALDYQL
ncbi:prohead protease [Thioalkalivibrio denitrificans]|uniref:Prohead protease n=2 Tax=Thioalkalivibrio denitrificans TaxID=108003 RepID=A0A1V3NHS6_9GAMM|nr:prohead protease [Thioalkalivibrio denitrificans]